MNLDPEAQAPEEVDLDIEINLLTYYRVCPVCEKLLSFGEHHKVTFSCFPSLMRHWKLEHPNEAPKSESAHDNGNVYKVQLLEGMVHNIPLWLELADEEDIARWVHSQQINWNRSAAVWRELQLPDLDREAHGGRKKRDHSEARTGASDSSHWGYPVVGR